MSLVVQLLGDARIIRDGDEQRFRSRKSWLLLAYLLLQEHPPPRRRLAELLFDEAQDPLRALRWGLAEIRSAIGPDGSVSGDPASVQLPADAVVDVDVLSQGSWSDAVAIPGFGGELLEGMTARGSSGFDSWLMAERRRLAAATEAILHEAALGSMAAGSSLDAVVFAERLVAAAPLVDNHQALLIRLYRIVGDRQAVTRQWESCQRLFRDELGVDPGPATATAMREPRRIDGGGVDDAALAAMIEAGVAAVAAGAAETGAETLRFAVWTSDSAGTPEHRVASRVSLGETLIHSVRGLDEEGLAALTEADRIAADSGDAAAQAEIRSELGYVDFLRARYDRAERRLISALRLSAASPVTYAKALAYLGSVSSDRGDYPTAVAQLEQAISLALDLRQTRRLAYGHAMLGRTHLLTEQFATAEQHLKQAFRIAEEDRWLAFLPWPQAMLGEVALLSGDPEQADDALTQAFARACQLGDPCWEGMAARGLAASARAAGDVDQALKRFDDAILRCNRMTDPYIWLDAYIRDARCALAVEVGHPMAGAWVDGLRELADACGMRDFSSRARRYGAALGRPGEMEAAELLA